ncbi:glycosyltransferase family 25 protein [Vibrio gallicus]|uniref:glycosyltransferase family 25 protein n=1 Tax=Vibrio gallicus TaxID=190897 RepID=UPI0021C45160|nr:glycosyltransferase family 25 protein [Vibrio gallicus]
MMFGETTVMKTFVISLKNSPRRERVVNLLNSTSLEYEFFDAISINDPKFHLYDKSNPMKTYFRKGFVLKATEVACFASHYALWERCIEIGQPIVILEDNIGLVEGGDEYIKSLYKRTDIYDYLKLSSIPNHSAPPIFHEIERINESLLFGYNNQETAGTTGYIITVKAARAFIQGATEFIDPVDNYLEKPWLHGIQVYSSLPEPCYRENVVSEIGQRKDKSNRSTLIRISKEIYRTYELFKRKRSWHTS